MDESLNSDALLQSRLREEILRRGLTMKVKRKRLHRINGQFASREEMNRMREAKQLADRINSA